MLLERSRTSRTSAKLIHEANRWRPRLHQKTKSSWPLVSATACDTYECTHRFATVRNSLADVLGDGRHLPGGQDARGRDGNFKHSGFDRSSAHNIDELPAESPNIDRRGVHTRLHRRAKPAPQAGLQQDAPLDLQILVAASPRLIPKAVSAWASFHAHALDNMARFPAVFKATFYV